MGAWILSLVEGGERWGVRVTAPGCDPLMIGFDEESAAREWAETLCIALEADGREWEVR